MQRSSVLYQQYAAQANNAVRHSELLSPVHASIDPRLSSIFIRAADYRERANQQQDSPADWTRSPSAVIINPNAWLPTEKPNEESKDIPKKSCLPPVWKNRLQGLLVGLAVAAIAIGITLGVLLTRPSTTSSSTTETTTSACSSLQWNQVSVAVAGNGSYGSTSGQFNNPWGIYVDSNYAIYVADRSNHRVQKWLPNATTGVTVAGITGISGSNGSLLSTPLAVYVDAQQNLYVADYDRISKWPSGASVCIQVPGASFNIIGFVYSLFVDTSGNLYASSSSNCVVRMWTPTATASTIVAGGTGCGSSSSQLYSPYGLAINSLTNTMYIANTQASTVVAWPIGATNGTIIAGTNLTYGAADSLLNNPRDVKLDQDGNLYILDTSNNRVILLCQNSVSTSARSIAGYKLLNPSSMALDSDLNLYVVSSNQVQKYTRIV